MPSPNRTFKLNGLLGLFAVGLLASCQSAPPPPSANVPTRPIEHAMGTTEVPISPERVVVLDSAPLNTAFALDVIPIGRPERAKSFIYPEVNNDIASVGEGFQPNIETIFNLKPDLILGSNVIATGSYQKLSRIAPTVFSRDNGRYGNWQQYFLLHADALSQLEKAEELLAEYQQRVDTVKSQLAQVPQTTTASVVTHWSGGVLAYTANSFSGAILQDLGFKRNPFQENSKKYALQPSKEDLATIDGDIIFLMHDAAFDGSIAKADFISDPLWSTLNAVEQGIVCEVSGSVWAGGRSILAANQILIDIETCLGSEQAAEN
ncbi:MAG: iron-siderophore ABC transporter substrate-binding protein [Cyanobacteria bacterium P01_F01_bin.13]